MTPLESWKGYCITNTTFLRCTYRTTSENTRYGPNYGALFARAAQTPTAAGNLEEMLEAPKRTNTKQTGAILLPYQYLQFGKPETEVKGARDPMTRAAKDTLHRPKKPPARGEYSNKQNAYTPVPKRNTIAQSSYI